MTPNQIKISARSDKWWASHHNEEIATTLGCHINTIANHRRRNKLPRGPRKPGSGSKPKVKREKIRLDKSVIWNARELGYTPNHMGTIMRQLRGDPVVPHRKREQKIGKRTKPAGRKAGVTDDWLD